VSSLPVPCSIPKLLMLFDLYVTDRSEYSLFFIFLLHNFCAKRYVIRRKKCRFGAEEHRIVAENRAGSSAFSEFPLNVSPVLVMRIWILSSTY